MNNRKLKFLAILLLSITIIIPAELSLVSSASPGNIYINSSSASSPGQQVQLGGNVNLYFGDIALPAGLLELVISQNSALNFTTGDIIYSPTFPTSYITNASSTIRELSNSSYGFWTLQTNWINGTIPRDIPAGNYYIKLFNTDNSQVVAVTDTYFTALSLAFLQVYPTSGTGGIPVQISGSGFSPNQPVEISYYDPVQKTWNPWEILTANASGQIVLNKEIPDLGASLSGGDNAEATKIISFKALGNDALGFADYNEYLRGLKTIADQTATGLFGNGTNLTYQVNVKVDDTVTISGKYFHPNDAIYVRWDGTDESLGSMSSQDWSTAQIVSTSIANSAGSFSAQFNVPLCSIGEHFIAVQDSQSKVIAKITVTNSTTLNLSPITGPGGKTVQLTGENFPAGSNVDLMYFDSAQSTWNLLSTVTSNQGHISYSFTVPDLGRSVGIGEWTEDSTDSVSYRAQINDIVYSKIDYHQLLRGIKTIGDYTVSGLLGNGTNLSDIVVVNSGDQITISGKWFHPNDVVYIRWDGSAIYGTVSGDEWRNAQILGSSIADSSGSFSTQITIPSADIGEHYIAIEDSNARVILKIRFSPGTLNISPSSGPGGVPVTISGQGYPASSPITLEYYDPQTSSWSTWMTNNSDPSGRISFSILVPDLRNYVGSGDAGYEPSYTSSYRVSIDGSIYGAASYIHYCRGLKTVGGQTATGLYGNGTDFTSTVQLIPGDSLRISGKYFNPGAVYIRWDGQAVVGTVTADQWSQTTPIGTTIANSAGYFDTSVSIPAAEVGSHFISVEDSQTRLIISVWLLQSTPPTPTPTPQPTQSPSPTPTPQPTATPTPTPTPSSNKPTPTINVQCKSAATNSGFRVEINGLLSSNGVGLSGKAVQLYYSKDGGASWESLTRVNTGSDGKFNAVWISAASGVFLLKAECAASSDYNQATAIVNFAIASASEGNTGETVFTVTSNSTITQLDFKSETSELSFVASGETGTKGYVTVNIPKTLISDISSLKVYLDNQAATFSSSQDQDSWIITITYTHSTHKIVMDLSSTQNQNNQQTTPWTIIGAGVATAIIAIAVIAVVMKKKPSKAKPDAF